MKYQKVILGGTFDLLHIGHQKLLNQAFSIGNFVRIGLTTDDFNHQRGKKTFEDQPSREKNLTHFLEQHFSGRYKIHHINDILGDAENDPELEAIFVTSETEDNAQLVNQERLKKNYSPLEIIVVEPSVDTSGKLISSTRIRNGKIDAEGNIWKKRLEEIADKPLSDEIKNRFKQPFGFLIHEVSPSQNKLVAVGDITTETFLKKGLVPDVSIVDLKSHRTPYVQDISQLGFTKEMELPVLITKNKPGLISESLINHVQEAFKEAKPVIILVTGEEDLAVIPAVLLSPLGTDIYYGQPGNGIVHISVTPTTKQQLWQMML